MDWENVDVGCGIGDFCYKPDAIGVDINKNNVNFCIDQAQCNYMQPDKLHLIVAVSIMWFWIMCLSI